MFSNDDLRFIAPSCVSRLRIFGCSRSGSPSYLLKLSKSGSMLFMHIGASFVGSGAIAVAASIAWLDWVWMDCPGFGFLFLCCCSSSFLHLTQFLGSVTFLKFNVS
ncbi:hypothetical protein RchiOBHm_Chr5g0080041 [Rosa chinensis]|uniref:Transmembrane protein n=1 Tax=Rosa chinensis TaxID=74649 RepID=A0A2P6QMP5_ROSCH|nr:hypothetical protein RchiOBHm_Chr5g0080041 [Rosa chinensis]